MEIIIPRESLACPPCPSLVNPVSDPRQIVYLAGPMRGHYRYNYRTFDEAKEMLEKGGRNRVINPVDLDREDGFAPETLPEDTDWAEAPEGFNLKDIAERALRSVRCADVICMLPGWEKSAGARAEKANAEWLGIRVNYYDPSVRTYMTDSLVDESGEVRVKDPVTGGEKGSKLARYDLIPAGPLKELAEHYGKGASKYEDNNWRKGYDWGLSFASAMRHLWEFWGGKDYDPETCTKSAVCAAWHCFTLAEFMDTHKEGDSRYII